MSDADWRRGDANSKGAAICGSKIRLDRVVPDFYPAVLFQENDNAMLIKHADDRTRDFETLKALAARPDASADTRKKIDQEIRNIQTGMKGEAEADYEMEFHYGASKKRRRTPGAEGWRLGSVGWRIRSGFFGVALPPSRFGWIVASLPSGVFRRRKEDGA